MRQAKIRGAGGWERAQELCGQSGRGTKGAGSGGAAVYPQSVEFVYEYSGARGPGYVEF